MEIKRYEVINVPRAYDTVFEDADGRFVLFEDIKILADHRDGCVKIIHELQEENEALKKEKDDLLNCIRIALHKKTNLNLEDYGRVCEMLNVIKSEV